MLKPLPIADVVMPSYAVALAIAEEPVPAKSEVVEFAALVVAPLP